MARSGVSRGWRSPACTRSRTERSRTAGTRKASGATKSWRISGWNLPSSGSAASSCLARRRSTLCSKGRARFDPRERAPTSVAEHAAQISIDLADERWLRKVAAKTSSMPWVSRFPRKRTNPTRRLARGLSGRTIIFAAATVRYPTIGSGRSTPQVPHLNVIKLRQWPRRRAPEGEAIRYRSTQGTRPAAMPTSRRHRGGKGIYRRGLAKLKKSERTRRNPNYYNRRWLSPIDPS